MPLSMEVDARRRRNRRTLATPLGLLLARLGGARTEPGPYGLVLARGDRLPLPPRRVPAFTVGDVVLLRLPDTALARRPELLLHEARHAEQWARWWGPLCFLPAYLVASAWSWLRTGSPALANAFERGAGLAEGGYASSAPRRRLRRRPRRRRPRR